MSCGPHGPNGHIVQSAAAGAPAPRAQLLRHLCPSTVPALPNLRHPCPTLTCLQTCSWMTACATTYLESLWRPWRPRRWGPGAVLLAAAACLHPRACRRALMWVLVGRGAICMHACRPPATPMPPHIRSSHIPLATCTSLQSAGHHRLPLSLPGLPASAHRTRFGREGRSLHVHAGENCLAAAWQPAERGRSSRAGMRGAVSGLGGSEFCAGLARLLGWCASRPKTHGHRSQVLIPSQYRCIPAPSSCAATTALPWSTGAACSSCWSPSCASTCPVGAAGVVGGRGRSSACVGRACISPWRSVLHRSPAPSDAFETATAACFHSYCRGWQGRGRRRRRGHHRRQRAAAHV